jgi:hypothetical protein
MIVTWNPLAKLTETVKQIVEALANRLTAAENFSPEGELGQFLGSNGPNSPPSYKDIGESISGNPALKGEKGDTGEQGPAGPAGTDGPPGADGDPGPMVPLTIGALESFTVPANRQALFAKPIVVDGVLVVSGELIEVD